MERDVVGRPVVVVIGAGFAGLNAAMGLRNAPVRVVVVDRQNYHLFQPLLYQVASAVLSPADIASPVRTVLRHQENAEVFLGDVKGFDLARNKVLFDGGEAHFDYLVVATGATHSYFGHDEWRKFAPGLKSIQDALEIRSRILFAFEEAEIETDEASRRAKLTFVIVGGGPTGVELAGALSEIAAKTIPRDFRHVDTKTARIILIEGSPHVLNALGPELGERAKLDLERMGVEVRVGKNVTNIDAQGVMIGDERIDAENVFWAAGVQASPLGKLLGAETDRAGRVKVNPDLTIPGRPNVFVLGDLASLLDPDTRLPVPGIAPAAIQMGQYVARVIKQETLGDTKPAERKPFNYLDKGTLATIGRAKAVGYIFGWKVKGFFAWLMWSLVHIAYLIGFRNRALVMLSWVWNYLLFGKSARLITTPTEFDIKKPRAAPRP